MNLHVFLFAAACCCVSSSALIPEDQSTNRISNGILAAEQQFPYVVSIQDNTLSTTATRGHLCGGVLVTSQYVLTAASCLYQGTANVLPATRFRVFSGSVLLTNDTVNNVRNVQNITIHPQYTGAPAHAFDAAVLGLASAFAANVSTPIALPAADFLPQEFTTCQIAGWGRFDSSSTVSVNLRFANKYIYNQLFCTLLYNLDALSPNVLNNNICATSFDMVSTGCDNDRGNPLICDGVLTGVLSISGQCVPSSRPELFTRVSNYTTWIRSVSAAPTIFPTAFITVMTAMQLLLTKISN